MEYSLQRNRRGAKKEKVCHARVMLPHHSNVRTNEDDNTPSLLVVNGDADKPAVVSRVSAVCLCVCVCVKSGFLCVKNQVIHRAFLIPSPSLTSHQVFLETFQAIHLFGIAAALTAYRSRNRRTADKKKEKKMRTEAEGAPFVRSPRAPPQQCCCPTS